MEDLRVAAYEFLVCTGNIIDRIEDIRGWNKETEAAYQKSRSHLISESHKKPAASELLSAINEVDAQIASVSVRRDLVRQKLLTETVFQLFATEVSKALPPLTRKLSLITGVMSGSFVPPVEYTPEHRPPAEWVLIFCRDDGTSPDVEWFRVRRAEGFIVAKSETTKKVRVAIECLPLWAKAKTQRDTLALLASSNERKTFIEAQMKPRWTGWTCINRSQSTEI